MKVIESFNANDALAAGLDHLLIDGAYEPSRNGRVLVSRTPVTTITHRPRERVLFSALRDANPFFHVMEAVWMLCGRDDVALPAKYAKQLELYSDDGNTLNGAYGARWRSHFGFDQLEDIIRELQENPSSRRCVLSMWDGNEDLQSAANGSKDVPCNTHIYFRVAPHGLDMTVCCRSNDAVWGAHGANVVHFSFLLEYVANCIGVRVGRMYQVSNNYHIYADREDVKRLLDTVGARLYVPDQRYHSLRPSAFGACTGGAERSVRAAWVGSAQTILHHALEGNARDLYRNVHDFGSAADPFLAQTVIPLAAAHEAYKAGAHEDAARIASQIEAPDWNVACLEWFQRRKDWGRAAGSQA